MTKSDYAREYRRAYTEMASAKLARIMYRDHPLVFKNAEDARNVLRTIEGKNKRNRKKSDVEFDRPARPYNPYKLPSSDESDYQPYHIKGHKRVLILSDIHVPYHNIPALTAAIKFGRKEKVDAVLLNGDAIDCHRLSRFVKLPNKRDFAGELATFKSLFEVLQKQLKCKIYFKMGNHEERYEHFLLEKAHELVGVQEFDFASIISARANGIEMIADKRYMLLNELCGIHGHEYIGGITAPVNPARGLFLKSKVSSFQGHNHQTSEHTEPTLTGKMVTTWSLGCLSELHPAYMPLNRWNHGFAMVDLDSNGRDFEFRNKRILKGVIL